MRAFLHHEPRHPHQLDAMCALGKGLALHGIHVDLGTGQPVAKCDFIAWWGDKVPPALRDRPRLILEAGYINGRSGDYVQDRLLHISSGWNGLHGRADPGPSDCPPDRWIALDEALRPWRTGGNIVLICDQHPGDSCAPNHKHWWSTAVQMCEETGAQLIYRPHPLLSPGMKPLAWTLNDAAVCVTWNSTAAIEAVIAGVPTIAMDRGSMVWEVSSHDVDAQLYLGEREQWAYDLAYRQWTHDELADGTAWESLGRDWR